MRQIAIPSVVLMYVLRGNSPGGEHLCGDSRQIVNSRTRWHGGITQTEVSESGVIKLGIVGTR